ncbi:molecular chaperone Hsp33 [uncultured Gammaproteobacteria bacterium]
MSASHDEFVRDDFVLPFQLGGASSSEGARVRGRLIRLGPVLNDILGRHAYPAPIAALVGETLVLAVLLAGMLKYRGVFTLQVTGDGPVRTLIADVVAGEDAGLRTVRAHARFDPALLDAVADTTTGVALLGEGHLAFTVDQGEYTERYQGVVALGGETLTDCVRHYFRQSEQIATGLVTAVGPVGDGWRVGGLVVQQLPDDSGESDSDQDGPDADGDVDGDVECDDHWRRLMVLTSTCTAGELIDQALPAHDLLHRLFHQEQAVVYPETALAFGCRCSRERVEVMLGSLKPEDLEHVRVDGQIEVTCEFCGTRYAFGSQ